MLNISKKHLKYFWGALLFLCASSQAEALSAAEKRAPARSTFLNVPLYFEENRGQCGETVKFLSRGPGYSFLFTPEKVAMVLSQQEQKAEVLTFHFINAKAETQLSGLNLQECKSN